MRVALNYGKGSLAVDFGPDVAVTEIRKPPIPVLADPKAAVAAALAHPIGAKPLAELARTARSACILICDITRPVPNGLFLPLLVETLRAAGLRPDAIRILVATGLHRPNEGAELRELIGDATVLDTIRVENHDAMSDADHAYVGTTTRGTVVRLDRRLLEADLRIATGLVEPHFMAGYSGGRKVIAPGVAHRETITTFHSARFMEDPRCANCVLEGNPLHEDQLEIMRLIGGALALNTVIDEQRRLSFVSFGEIVESHGAAVSFARRYAEVAVAERFATVVTSAAGYPLDKTYYQTVKGMVGPLDILAPGGDLIIASECSEGIGSRHYAAAQARLLALGSEGFLAAIKQKRHADIDEWQTEMQLKPMRVGRIHLYSDRLSAEDAALTGVERVASVDEAVRQSLTRHGTCRVAVIPEGPYIVPVYRS
ncbi:MAG: nickel-dependent lactate racemase [Alphaproteobacteria bacterium]|nr:nickel-dependent lactate racemase [Alphaproteobacteria bacterium]